jgi:diadenosine tetraphosphate (Ap4A) HIT family hydrolase
MTCLFCEIVASAIPAEIVYQDSDILAFRDIKPQAPQHVLVIPKRHIESVLELGPGASMREVSAACSTAAMTRDTPSTTSTCISSAAAP